MFNEKSEDRVERRWPKQLQQLLGELFGRVGKTKGIKADINKETKYIDFYYRGRNPTRITIDYQ